MHACVYVKTPWLQVTLMSHINVVSASCVSFVLTKLTIGILTCVLKLSHLLHPSIAHLPPAQSTFIISTHTHPHAQFTWHQKSNFVMTICRTGNTSRHHFFHNSLHLSVNPYSNGRKQLLPTALGGGQKVDTTKMAVYFNPSTANSQNTDPWAK